MVICALSCSLVKIVKICNCLNIVPSSTKMLPEDYVERVKEIHESGGYQSRGYGIQRHSHLSRL